MAANEMRVNLLGNASDLLKALSKADSKLQKFGQKAKAVGKSMTTYVTAPIAIAGGFAIKMASDFEESLNKVDVAFGKSNKEIKTFAETSKVSFGIAEGSALDMAAMFGDMGTSMGLTQKDAAGMSKSLVGLAGDLSSFKNIQVDVATTALAAIFTGETESLKKLGIVMTEANLKHFALSQGIQKNIKDMSQAEKTQLRYAFIMANTTNAQGDFIRTQDGAANQMRIFGEGVKELTTEFGQLLLPAFTKIVTAANKIIDKFIALDSTTKKTILIVAGLAAAIGPVLLALGTLITLAPALGTAFTVMTGPVGAVVAALAAVAYVIVNNWKPIKKAVNQVINYFIDLYNESLGFRIIIETIGIAFKLAFIQAKLQMKLIYTVVVGVFKSIADVIGNFGTILKGVFTLDSDLIKIGVSEMTKSLKSGFDDIVKNVKVETDNATKESMKVIADGLNNIIGGEKPKIIIEAEVVTTGDSGTSGDTKTKGISGIDDSSTVDPVKLAEATNKALLTTEAKRFAAELKATEAHYNNLISLNKGNAEVVKQLETSKGEALATITQDANQKKVDLMAEMEDASAVSKEQRMALEIQREKDYYKGLIDEAVKFDLATDALQAARDAKVQQIMDSYNEKTSIFTEIQDQLIGSMQQGFGALGTSIADSLGAGESAMGTFAGVLIQTALTALSTSLAGTMGASLEAGANTAKGMGPIGAFVLPALLAGAAVAVKGAFGKVEKPKKFAKGGIVSTPTMGLMGEYPGARSNPEVVAPLDKLKKMIGDRGGSSVQVGGEFVLKGQDLIVALQRANNQRNRII
tara:strand:- start:2551 stop:4968 length:2418 start_codon:yes stop_codon:yes gene_type:complete